MMTKYNALRYLIPPRCQNQTIELAFSITEHEIVRRTTNRSTGAVTYETADQIDMTGDFDPQNRVPSVFRKAWTVVDGDELTPA